MNSKNVTGNISERKHETPYDQSARSADSAAKSYSRLRLNLVALFSIVAITSCLVLGWSIYEDRVTSLRAAEHQLGSLSRVLEEHTARTLDAHRVSEMILLQPAFLDAVERRDEVGLHNYLKTRLQDVPQLATWSVFDHMGTLLATTLMLPAPKLNYLDRDYFQAARGSTRMEIGLPVLGKLSKKWNVPFAKAVRGSNGEFKGVFLTNFDPDYLGHFYADLARDLPVTVLMVRDDGAVLVRYPFMANAPGYKLTGNALSQALSMRRDSGFVEGVDPFDQAGRLYAFRRVAGQPITMFVGLNREVVLQRWFRDTTLKLCLLGVMLSGMCLLLVAGLRQINRSANAEQHRIQVEYARYVAEEANREKSRFLANMSHELRTPLNAIIGLSDLMERSPLTEQQHEWMRTLTSSTEILLAQVNNLLDLAQIEAGKLTLEKRPFCLSKLIDNVANVQCLAANQKDISLTVLPLPPNVDWLIGDPDRVQQVLLNLVANGVKFTERGTVSINVEVINKEEEAIELLWSVTDTGIGMTLETVQNIFGRFQRGENYIRRRYGGSGLGTTISKELVELMGGKIGVESTVGKGSRVWFSLRFETLKAAPSSTESLLSTDCSLRLLLVEDNVVNRSVAMTMLERDLHQLDAAADVISALFHLVSKSYDAVLLDVELPNLSGIDLLRVLRQKPCYAHLPILMLTAHATPEVKAMCEAAGSSLFLTKPLKIAQLRSALATLGTTDKKHTPPLLDPNRLLDQYALGGVELIEQLTGGWQEDGNVQLSALSNAMAGSQALMKLSLHALEGIAGEVGAISFLNACHQLRLAIDAADSAKTDLTHQNLIDLFAATTESLHLLLQLIRSASAYLPAPVSTDSVDKVQMTSADLPL